MNTLLVCINAVLPIFLMILVGFVCRRTGIIKENLIGPFNKVGFHLFLSAQTFYNIYSSDFSGSFRPKLILYACGSVVLICLLAMWYAEKRIPDRRQRGVFVQGVFRSNYTIIGLPFLNRLLGDGADMGVPTILLAFIVPLYNVLAVVALEKYNGEKADFKKVLLGVIRNPLIIGAVLGILFQITGLTLPTFLLKTVKDLGAASSPVMLVLLGAFLTKEGVSGSWKMTVKISVLRLLVCPIVFTALAVALGFRGVELAALVVLFGSSAAVSSFTMAEQMGGDAELAGSVVILTSALCSFTMGIFSYVLMMLGFV